MAHLPEGWEADYDGTRWFYRFATTGLTQYHFPRPGDEYPELVGLGFGALDISAESKLASKHHEEHQGSTHGVNSAGVVSEPGRDGPKQTASAHENGSMSATGYFNPDDFMYFGLNDVSPVGDNKSEPALAELPESEQIRSPVGFMAELANNDTAKCAEELAPIELDATQIASAVIQTEVQPNGPAELSAQRSTVEQKQSAEQPIRDTTQHVEEYPLVSASFAYPPLKAASKPLENVEQKADSPPQLEQKVLVTQQPMKDHTGESGYETWKPAQGTTKEESTNPNRQSIAVSSISVIQSQNNDLGPMEQKRHSLSGPVSSTETSVPGILRPPSDPRIPTASSSPPPKVESLPIPAVLQPATAPSKVPSPQDNFQKQPAQNGVPSLPGSGARHESISFSGPPVVGSNSTQIPSALKPAHDRQSFPPPQNQPLPQTQVDNVRPGAHRVNTMPAQPSSHTASRPKINGPGIYVFQEIPAASQPTSGQGPYQDGSNRPHEPIGAQFNSGAQEAGQFNQSPSQPHPITNESLPIVVPLNPRKPVSPNMASSSFNTPNGPMPGAQSEPASNPANNSQSGTGQAQGKPKPQSTGSPSQEVNVYQSPQPIRPASYQGPMLNSTLPQKLIRKPVLPQRPEKPGYNTGAPMIGSPNNPARPNHPAHQQAHPSTASPRPTSVVQAQPHSAPPQTHPGAPHGQIIQAHNQRPSISGSSSQSPQHTSAAHATSASSLAQGQSPISNMQATVQRPNQSPGTLQASTPVAFPGRVSSPPATVHTPISRPQSTMQRPPSQASPGQRPPNGQPMTQGTGQVLNQNGPASGPVKPQTSSSPITQPVSPLQSQVSSPAPSIASLPRPPSSASSLSTQVTGQSVMSQGHPATHQNHPHVVRPTATPAAHAQGNQQANQPPKPPVAGPSKPFPMLPGQVTPLPSQVGSTSGPMSNQPAPTTQVQAQHLQNHPGQIRPSQQHPGNQPLPQTAVHRPPQQQPAQTHHTPNAGGSMSGQSMPGGIQQGQPRPHANSAPVQQHTHALPHSNITNLGLYNNQGIGHTGQPPNGQSTVGLAQGVAVQGQFQATLSSNVASPQAQAYFNNQQAGQGQGHQQYNQTPGAQVSPYQTFGQNKPFNSAQAAAALSDAGKKMNDAGKKMKKWAKKTWQNPSVKQTTAAVSGAIIAESIGGDGVAGAALANRIYGISQGTNQPQRPPGLQHANTAPPQAQHMAGVGATHQHIQAMNRPQLQQGMQPMGVQTPGRPPVVQNPGMIGGAANNSMIQQQQQPQMRPNMMMNQQAPQQISRPPVGRPPSAQPQQPAAFGQPMYQGTTSQPMFQPRPVQTPYQTHPGQPMYQMPPNQPYYQAQGGADPYAALGSVLGNAVNALSAGGRTNEAPQATHQQQQSMASEPQHEYQPSQHQVADSEAHHEGQSEQHHGGQQEHHAEQPEQYNGGNHEQQYTNQSEQHHESYAEGNHASHSEPHQEAYTESHQETYTEQQQYADYSEQQNTVYSEETGQNNSEQQHGAYAEPPPEGENSYFANPQPETTIINNNTIINNVDNSNTAVANSTQNTTEYTDNSQVSQVMETNNASAEANSYVDTTYMDTTNNTTGDTTAYADTTYTDTTGYTDTSNMNMDMNANAEAVAYADASAYVDSSSYADTTYTDATYTDATYVDVSMEVDVNVETNQTMYMEEQNTMMMEESVSVDASAYAEVDYSGGEWGSSEW